MSSFIFMICVALMVYCVKLLVEVTDAENKENLGLTELAGITYGN